MNYDKKNYMISKDNTFRQVWQTLQLSSPEICYEQTKPKASKVDNSKNENNDTGCILFVIYLKAAYRITHFRKHKQYKKRAWQFFQSNFVWAKKDCRCQAGWLLYIHFQKDK